MMIIKLFMTLLLYIWSRVFSYQLSRKLCAFRNYIYTLWLRNYLGYVGDNSSIQYPCSLQGGGAKYIKIGNHTVLYRHCILGSWLKYGEAQQFTPEICIGNQCSIGEYNHITAIKKVIIGDGLLTGRFVYIGDNNHGGLSWEESIIPPAQRKLSSKGEIIIGNNVWIGDKVTILGGVTIGDNVIIGANSVVTHDVPSNCLSSGVPARVIKQL